MLNPTGIRMWGDANVLLASSSPAFPRQDADYQKPFSFTAQGECTLDNLTGLMWSPSCPMLSATACAAYATQARFGGYSDWRMPTVKELESITDFGRLKPALDPAYFPGTQAMGFEWTDTPKCGDPASAWYVNLANGFAGTTQKTGSFYVRLVRGALVKSVYVANGDGTVTDTTLGLMWKKDHEMNDSTRPDEWQTGVNTFLWQESLQRAVNDRTGGFTDWRLPNIKELRSLVDEGRSRPALDPAFTPTPFQAWFWSSSPPKDVGGYQNYAMCVNADYGTSVNMMRGGNTKRYARLVRDAGNAQPMPVPAPIPAPSPTLAPPPEPVSVPVPVPAPGSETLTAFKQRLIKFINA